jgi:RNA polymerase sigma-70 factor, ECF subfamily
VPIYHSDFQAIQQGDERVFEEFFRKYYQSLCNYACTFLKDMEEAEEAVQAVFHHFWEKKATLEISTSLKSYFYKSVHNNCLNRIKHAKIKLEYQHYNAERIDQNPSYASHLAEANELESRIAQAVESLPEQCRLVFKLSRFEELKYAEIADQLGISVKTVENQMGKALRVLREKLADYLVFMLLFGIQIFNLY